MIKPESIREEIMDKLLNKRSTLKELFRDIDKDRSGEITHDEFIAAVENLQISYPSELIRDWLKCYDLDDSQTIDYNEFCGLMDGELQVAQTKIRDPREPEIIDKVRQAMIIYMQDKGLRVVDMFRLLDPFKSSTHSAGSGFIKPEEFRRGVKEMLNITFDRDQREQVDRYFALYDNDHRISFAKLLDFMGDKRSPYFLSPVARRPTLAYAVNINRKEDVELMRPPDKHTPFGSAYGCYGLRRFIPEGQIAKGMEASELANLRRLILDKMDEHYRSVNDLFIKFDISRSGQLSIDELRLGLDMMNISLTREQCARLIGHFGIKESEDESERKAGSIDYNAFVDFLSDDEFSSPKPHRSPKKIAGPEQRVRQHIRERIQLRGLKKAQLFSYYFSNVSRHSSSIVFDRLDLVDGLRRLGVGDELYNDERVIDCVMQFCQCGEDGLMKFSGLCKFIDDGEDEDNIE